jgi:plasmid stabilization system protein ParE
MKYTVVWTDVAEKELALIWQQAEDRAGITSAAYRIEQELRRRPEVIGEEFYGDRIVQYGPLAVAYEFEQDDRLVRVIQVMQIKE